MIIELFTSSCASKDFYVKHLGLNPDAAALQPYERGKLQLLLTLVFSSAKCQYSLLGTLKI